MEQAPATTRPKLRIDLRSLLLWTVYAAIGLAMGSAPIPDPDPALAWLQTYSQFVHWVYAMLGAASAAIAVGLVQQARAIHRQAADWSAELAPLRGAARWEAALRGALAVVILFCMTTQFLSMRHFFKLPEGDLFFYGDIVTQYLWWLAIVAVLGDATIRVATKVARHRWWIADAIVWIGALFLATYIVIELSTINYLVHVACNGVDGVFRPEYRRYPIMTLSDERLLFGTAAAAVAAVVVAAVLFVRALANRGLCGPAQPATLVPLALLLAVSGGYALWFYEVARNHYSPDLENIGFGASRWHQAGGAALATLAVTYVVYRGWHAAAARSRTLESTAASMELPLAGENLIALFVLLAASVVHMVQITCSAVDGPFSTSVLDDLAYLSVYPSTYFGVAILLMSLRLIRFRWKGRAPAPLVVVPVKSRDFVASWLILAAIVGVAVPTLAAFSFSFWLGPWYRW